MSFTVTVRWTHNGALQDSSPWPAEDLQAAQDLLSTALEDTAGARDLDGTLEAAQAVTRAYEAQPGEVIELGGYEHFISQEESNV